MPSELLMDDADFLWAGGWGEGGLLDDVDADAKLSTDESDDASSEATPAATRKADDDVVCEALILRGTGGRTLPGSSLRSYRHISMRMTRCGGEGCDYLPHDEGLQRRRIFGRP